MTSDPAAAVDRAVDRADLDELLRLVDGLCSARDWDALALLRDRCRRAHESGRQLWPAAAHAEYRLALEAPGAVAATMLVDGTGRFAFGPLAEVAASTHGWDELAPHVAPGPPAVVALHERVVRGEDLTAVTLPGPPVLELPARLEPWEPAYTLAEYRPHHADFPAPGLPALVSVVVPGAPARHPATAAGAAALRDLVAAWRIASEGRADATGVEGDAVRAVAALGPRHVRMAQLEPATSLALMAWAGASGGAHGRRPGAAAGRFGAWWTVATLAGTDGGGELDPDLVGAALGALRWYLWDAGEPATGWRLQLAVEDPARGLAWAVSAIDAR